MNVRGTAAEKDEMPVYLKDLPVKPELDFIADDDAFARFQLVPDIGALNWPADVLRQWIWDHGTNDHFLRDYAALDLSLLNWTLEKVPSDDFMTLVTGVGDGDAIEEYAANHHYWMELKNKAKGTVRSAWEDNGTWVVPPVAIARCLMEPSGAGLHLIEGRTRVGVLRGRQRAGLNVAPKHLVWVGRKRGSEQERSF